MILQNWWYTTLLNTEAEFQPPLRSNITCEVAVIGGGMSGLHAALQLAKLGKKVVLLERNICGGSSTGKSAGFLTPDSELELSQLVRRYGIEGARGAWSMPVQGIGLILESIKEFDLQCDLVTQDSFFLGIGSSGTKAAREEAKSRADLKFPYTLYPDAKSLQAVIGGKGYGGGVRYGQTYGINPLLYAQELKMALIRLGVKIFESTEVLSIDDHTAKAHLGSVTADQFIVCIDKMKSTFSLIAENTYHAQTFLCISEPLEEKDIREIFPAEELMCWDSRLVYSYYRLTGDRRLLLGGGSAMTTFSRTDVNSPDIIGRVITDFKKRFPKLHHVDFIQYWPGRIDTTKDIMPIVDWYGSKHIQYVLGCVGLPWAAFCGAYAARRLFEPHTCEQYCKYLGDNRRFLVSPGLQQLIGKMISFSLNNAYSKYLQRDANFDTAPSHSHHDGYPGVRVSG